MLFLLLLLLLDGQLSTTVATPMSLHPNCSDRCGDVMIPYPFGIEDGCYYPDASHFLISCNQTTHKPLHGNFPLLHISITNATIRILTGVAVDCYGTNTSTTTTNKYLGRFSFTNVTSSLLKLHLTITNYSNRNHQMCRFHFSASRNLFTGVGCDTVAFLSDNTVNASMGCLSTCSSEDSVHDNICNGGGCCQNSELPVGLQNITMFVSSFNNHEGVVGFNPCSYAFLVDADEFRFNKSYYLGQALSRDGKVPTLLDWAVGHGTNCYAARMNSLTFACKENSDCSNAVDGNGYVSCNGTVVMGIFCLADIDECSQPDQYECHGTCYNTQGSWSCVPKKHIIIMIVAIGVGLAFIAVVIQSCVLYNGMNIKRLNNRKAAFFKRNGGLMLQDNLSQVEHAQNAFKMFTAEEMEGATDNFDRARIVGSGGFADVYRGNLSDGTVVAIKKPKTKSLEETEVDAEFINEVTLLAKIQHHNVVTFLGCCLETEAPLLVYEFIANGTLLDHLHKEGGGIKSWGTRLKIAAETAGVLSYLHFDHRPSIIHSDIKPQNILLGDDYTAKVSDFGISKQAPQNETELYTRVKGTLGYLDPEFMQSGQLTEKSDVYSFGVVLLELLTGQKVLHFDRPKSDWCLVNYFRSSFGRGEFNETLDTSIVNEENIKQLRAVAKQHTSWRHL